MARPKRELPTRTGASLRRELSTARREWERTARQRDKAIAKAVSKGMPLREVGGYVGLSHVAVRDIAAREPK
jgi:hypothetical protein